MLKIWWFHFFVLSLLSQTNKEWCVTIRVVVAKHTMINYNMINEIEKVANAIKGGQMGVVIAYDVEPTWASVKSPYKGRVRKLTTVSNCGFGIRFENVVESHAERCGVDTEKNPYNVAPRNGMHFKYEGNPRFCVGNKNTEQHYLILVYRGNECKSTQWMLDGKVVTDEAIISDIKSFIRKPSDSKKQSAYGVTAEEQVVTISPKFENITLIKQGNNIYERREQIAYRIAE